MGRFQFFHSTKTSEEDIQRKKDCIAKIKQAVCNRCGIDPFIEDSDFTVAFAGSENKRELMLEICTQKYQGKNYLYASVDDEVSWQEWDFDNLDEFENHIINYLANRVNRTIKTVTEVNNKNFRVTSYYRDQNGEWVCFEEDSSDCGFLTAHLAKSGETVKTYQLKN